MLTVGITSHKQSLRKNDYLLFPGFEVDCALNWFKGSMILFGPLANANLTSSYFYNATHFEFS